MKTPMQLLFARLNEMSPSLFSVHTKEGRFLIENLHHYICLEKQRFKEVYQEGHRRTVASFVDNKLSTHLQTTAEQFYDLMFGSNNEQLTELLNKSEEE